MSEINSNNLISLIQSLYSFNQNINKINIKKNKNFTKQAYSLYTVYPIKSSLVTSVYEYPFVIVSEQSFEN